jgi:thymidylate kinase
LTAKLKSRFIYFAGVDGTGKSTFINRLIQDFAVNGIQARRVWLRFNYFLTRIVLLYCRLSGLTRKVNQGGKVIRVHDFHKSRFIAKSVQYLHFVDTCLMYFFKAYLPWKLGNQVILCDRFVYDILADFMLESKEMNLPESRISHMFLKLIPKEAVVIFITAEKEKIIQRKPEVLFDDEDFDLKYHIFDMIQKRFNLNSIENNSDPEKVFLQILERIYRNDQKDQNILLATPESLVESLDDQSGWGCID